MDASQKTCFRSGLSFISLLLGILLAYSKVSAQEPVAYKQAEDSREVFIGPDNKARLVLSPPLPAGSRVSVSEFQNYQGQGFPADLKLADSQIEPLVLTIPATDISGPFWGYLAINDRETYGLSLARFGPGLLTGESLRFAGGEKAWLELDISQQLAYGQDLEFRVTVQDFESGETLDIYKSGTAQMLMEEGKSLLPLNITQLDIHTRYLSTLETRVGETGFLPRRFYLTVEDRKRDGLFKAVPDIVTEKSSVRLSIEAVKRLQGISASTQTASTARFNPATDVEITLNNYSLWLRDTSDNSALEARSLAAGDIQEIEIRRSKLMPGKHQFTLELSALNAKESLSTEITFVVKKHAAWAFSALILGVLLSFVVTKGLKLGFERGALRKRINAIKQQSWLRNDRWGAQPIVRAFIRVIMADRALNYRPPYRWLNKVYLSRLVTAPQILATEIEQVEGRLEVYSKLNRIAIRWGVAPSSNGSIKGMDYRIMWRANKEVRYLVYKLSQLHNDEKIPAEVLAKLDRLEAWSDPDVLLKEYQVSQKRDIDKLLPQIDEKRFEDKISKKYCTQLRDILMKPRELKTIHALLEVEENYILLKLLWEQRRWPARCRKLVEKMEAKHALEVILEEFDEEIWQILNTPETLRIVMPEGGAIEQYALNEFKVECARPEANTFLFKHGLKFEWYIDYKGKKPLTPITRGPSVTQFIPQISPDIKVEVSVQIRWGDKCISLEGEKALRFTTRPTRRFKDLWPVNSSEIASVIIALLLALLAGFQSDAFNEALQGSWPELLVLLAWGIGADQMKNLIQNLNTLGR